MADRHIHQVQGKRLVQQLSYQGYQWQLSLWDLSERVFFLRLRLLNYKPTEIVFANYHGLTYQHISNTAVKGLFWSLAGCCASTTVWVSRRSPCGVLETPGCVFLLVLLRRILPPKLPVGRWIWGQAECLFSDQKLRRVSEAYLLCTHLDGTGCCITSNLRAAFQWWRPSTVGY